MATWQFHHPCIRRRTVVVVASRTPGDLKINLRKEMETDLLIRVRSRQRYLPMRDSARHSVWNHHQLVPVTKERIVKLGSSNGVTVAVTPKR